MIRRHLALFIALAASSSLLGCEDETTTDDSVQVEPPTMELQSPAEGACVAIGADPNARVSFVLKTSWLYLRPPGVCGEAAQCGQLVLWINDEIVARAASNVIEWDVASAVNRYGEFHARIAAVADDGKLIADTGKYVAEAGDKPLEVTRTFTTAVTCPANP
ncbi:MAG TPA: hypothetical protein PKA58_10800 [Polyangium sp.]|nr:hypothetical protein [Polyangium sp.]